MKITVKTFTVFTFFVFLSSSPDHAQGDIQGLFGDAASINNILIVQTQIGDIQKPVITKMIIHRGLTHFPQKEALQTRDVTKYQIEVRDSSNQPLLRMNFQYPGTIIVPMILPVSDQAVSASNQHQVQIDRPEANLVLPYLFNASSVHIFEPGQESPAASMSMGLASVSKTPDMEEGPLPVPSEPGKFHILLMASGYSLAQMSTFNSRAQSVQNQILATEPFSSNSSNIEIHIYENTSDIGCSCGCFSIPRLMCCTSNSVISAAATSGYYYDEIIVIHNTGTYCGGGYRDYGSYETDSYSTYTMIYDGLSSELMALHEFGHSFGNLCDEYSYGGEGYTYYDCANCKPSCSDWTGLTDACNLSCDAKSTYYRPDDSIMLILSAGSYNSVSIRDSLTPRLSYFTSGAAPDTTLPANASVTINSGSIDTSSTSVTLNLSATDDVGVTGYYASESSIDPSAGDSGWVSVTSATSYSADVSFDLSASSGTKTIYVWFKDAAGNISSSANDSTNLSVPTLSLWAILLLILMIVAVASRGLSLRHLKT